MDEKVLKILRELEKNKEHALFWNVPAGTGRFLNMLIRVMKAKRVLEIGTSNGYSAIYLAEALSHTGGVLYTVESHRQRYLLAQENLAKSGLGEYIHQVFGHAPEILPEIPGEFDFIFLDATKMEYKSYAEVLLPRLKAGGLMVADNASTHGKEMEAFFGFVNGCPQLQSVLLEFDNGLMLSYRG